MSIGAHFEPFELVGRYLTNPELLAVNQVRQRPLSGQPDLAVGSHWASAGSNGPRCFQDKWGVQGSLVDMGDGSHIYGKPLSDGSFAVALLNLGIFAFDAPFPIASHYLPALSPTDQRFRRHRCFDCECHCGLEHSRPDHEIRHSGGAGCVEAERSRSTRQQLLS